MAGAVSNSNAKRAKGVCSWSSCLACGKDVGLCVRGARGAGEANMNRKVAKRPNTHTKLRGELLQERYPSYCAIPLFQLYKCLHSPLNVVREHEEHRGSAGW